MSVLGADDIRALMGESATHIEDDDALQEVINGEEAWLERRIGPLVGERSETFTPLSDDIVYLRRPARAVEVTDDGDLAVVVLRSDGRAFTRLDDYWLGTVVVTYEPDDEVEVRRVVAELVRLALQESGGYQSERIGEYSYTVDSSLRGARRFSLVRSLLSPATPGTVRIHSSVVE